MPTVGSLRDMDPQGWAGVLLQGGIAALLSTLVSALIALNIVRRQLAADNQSREDSARRSSAGSLLEALAEMEQLNRAIALDGAIDLVGQHHPSFRTGLDLDARLNRAFPDALSINEDVTELFRQLYFRAWALIMALQGSGHDVLDATNSVADAVRKCPEATLKFILGRTAMDSSVVDSFVLRVGGDRPE